MSLNVTFYHIFFGHLTFKTFFGVKAPRFEDRKVVLINVQTAPKYLSKSAHLREERRERQPSSFANDSCAGISPTISKNTISLTDFLKEDQRIDYLSFGNALQAPLVLSVLLIPKQPRHVCADSLQVGVK